MSRVDFDPYLPGEARDVTKFNTAVQALVTQSSSVDDTNFAQEGLTRLELAHRPRRKLFDIRDSTRDATGLNSTTWATFAQSGTSFEYLTNFTLFEQKLLIRWRAFFSSRAGSPGIDNAASPAEFRLAVKKTTAAETQHSYRKLGFGTLKQNGWASGFWLIEDDATYDYVRLEYQVAGAGAIRPNYSSMYGILINRDT